MYQILENDMSLMFFENVRDPLLSTQNIKSETLEKVIGPVF